MKEKIVIVCSRLDYPGGIERASVNLANMFEEYGHDVTLLILDVPSSLFYSVNKGVHVLQKPWHFGITKKGNVVTRKLQFLNQIRALRRLYKQLQPTIVLSTEYSLTIPSIIAARNLATKVIGWEHHHFYWIKKNRFWNFLFKKTYPKLDAVVCLNSSEKRLFETMGCWVNVIPNMAPQQDIQATLDNKLILSIGWLIKRKGFDLLPEVAELVFKKFPDWKWKLIGEGELFDYLQEQLKKKNLEEKVIIQKPSSPQLDDEYLNASIFVLLSRFECLPLVVLEATTFGLPTVAFNCPTGPADIIHHNEDGYLAPIEDVQAIAENIIELIENAEKRKAFGREAYRNSKRYAKETIYKKWMELFSNLKA